MKEIHFEQSWETQRTINESFELLSQAFVDSEKSPVWPSQYSSLKAKDSPLRPGVAVDAVYSAGPINSKASYLIEDVQEPTLLSYKTGSKHSLIGGATITLEKISENTTLIKWSGKYERKSLKGVIALIWFKTYFENRFFGALKKAFNSAK